MKFTKTEDEFGKTWDYEAVFAYLQPDDDMEYLLELDGWDGGWFTKETLRELIAMLQDIEKEWPDESLEDDSAG